MRLLSTAALLENGCGDFKVFVGEDKRPVYAILSHAWGEEEVSLQEMQGPRGPNTEKKGYKKIQAACERARNDGMSWVWIDTCNIDKTSSAELSEAINSMYEWYKNAHVCYVHLEGVPTIESIDISALEVYLANCKWISRGWTLQELIAPGEVEFLSESWEPCLPDQLARKSGLDKHVSFCNMLSTVTGVDVSVLRGQKTLGELSIATKMSWASNRKTTRSEDIAYCLLGLFEIAMPLIYGEGEKKAFTRLQEELMKDSDDHSLFAWRSYRHPKGGYSLLADSPADFASSRGIMAFHNWTFSSPYSMTNLGLRINLPLRETFYTSPPKVEGKISYVAALNCVFENDVENRLVLYLQRLTPNGDQYARVNTGYLSTTQKAFDEYHTIYVRKSIVPGDVSLADSYIIKLQTLAADIKLHAVWPPENWETVDGERVLHVSPNRRGGIAGAVRFEGPKHTFAVVLGPKSSIQAVPGCACIEKDVTKKSSWDDYCHSWGDRLRNQTQRGNLCHLLVGS